MNAVEAGRRLAERHDEPAEPDADRSLLNYAEIPYEGDWTLRSALCRLAQPEPVRVGAVLELLRRLDAPLHHVRRTLEQHTVTADRNITIAELNGPPADPYPDIRTADLARLAAAGADRGELVQGYEEAIELEQEERLAVPLLEIAVTFERLAATLTAWALTGPGDRPIEDVDRACADVEARLDELGVPRETGPPPRGSRSGRS